MKKLLSGTTPLLLVSLYFSIGTRPAFCQDEVPEHVIWVDDADSWRGEVWAGAANPGGALQGPRMEAGLAYPGGPGRMCFVGPGEAYVAGQGILFRLDSRGVFTYFAGSPEMAGYQDGPASGALFGLDLSIFPDGRGGLYVGDRFNRCLRRVFQKGQDWYVETVAGDPENPASSELLQMVRSEIPDPEMTAEAYRSRADHDGKGRQATFSYLHSNVIVDPAGTAYLFDADFLRTVSPNGQVRTLNPKGGTGNPGPDGEPLESAHFRVLMQSGIGWGPDGSIFVADRWNHCVRRIDLKAGTVSTVIGPGKGYIDGPSAKAAFHDSPGYIIYDPYRARFHVNGVDDWGMRVWEKGEMRTLGGGKRSNQALSGKAPDIGFHWCGTFAVDPAEPHDIYFWSGAPIWRGRIGRLTQTRLDGAKEVKP